MNPGWRSARKLRPGENTLAHYAHPKPTVLICAYEGQSAVAGLDTGTQVSGVNSENARAGLKTDTSHETPSVRNTERIEYLMTSDLTSLSRFILALHGILKVNNSQMYGKLNQLGNIYEL